MVREVRKGLQPPRAVLGSKEPTRHTRARKTSRWVWPEPVITDCGRSQKSPPILTYLVEVSHLLPRPQSSSQVVAQAGKRRQVRPALPRPHPAPTGSASPRLHPHARTPPSHRSTRPWRACVGFPTDVTFQEATSWTYHVRPDCLSHWYCRVGQ